jgi:hypothetical protein
VQSLQVELSRRLGGDESHRRALHRLGNRFRVAKIVFLPFAIRAQTSWALVAHRDLALAAYGLVMCADTGLHPDQAQRHVGKPCFDLAA